MSVPERYPLPSEPPSEDPLRHEDLAPSLQAAVQDPDPSQLPEDDTRIRRQHKLRRPLPLWMRILLLLIGWIVVLVGVAGLILPGIQGIATILIGAAILSLASEIAYEWTRWSLRRWPWLWDKVDRFRDRMHDKLHDLVHRS